MSGSWAEEVAKYVICGASDATLDVGLLKSLAAKFVQNTQRTNNIIGWLPVSFQDLYMATFDKLAVAPHYLRSQTMDRPIACPTI